MNVKVPSGEAWIKGHFYENTALETLAIGTANPTNPRIDRIVVRLDWTNNTIYLAVLQGVPAASPNPPAVTMNSAIWDINLANVRVNAGVTTIATGDVSDIRQLISSSAEYWTPVTLENSWLHEDFNGLSYRMIGPDLQLEGKIRSGVVTGNTTVGRIPLEILPPGRQIMIRAIGIDAGGLASNVYLWVHATTREIKLYGSGQTNIIFDGTTIRDVR
jgi:hypothetical protein